MFQFQTSCHHAAETRLGTKQEDETEGTSGGRKVQGTLVWVQGDHEREE